MGYDVKEEVYLPIVFRGEFVEENAFRIDLMVDNELIVELKSVAKVQPVDKKQLQTYLKLAKKKLGLLINFNVVLLKDGITRVVNGFIE